MRLCARWLLAVGLLLLTLVAYLPLGSNDFIDFDDELYLTTNPHVLKGLTWEGFRWAWTNHHGNYWMPLSWLSLELDGRFFSVHRPDGQTVLSAPAIHFESLAWHAASVLLLFYLLLRLTGLVWRSFFVAALFAVHPMHVESVAWASERKDVLMAFFGLLTLLAYVRYQEQPGLGRYLLVLLAYLLSLLSKPMLMTLPLVLLLLDYWPLRRLAAGPGSLPLRWLLLEKVPLILLAGGAAVAALVTRNLAGTLMPLSEISLSARLANAVTAYGWYVYTTVWPQHLAALYPHPLHNWSLGGVVVGAGFLVVVTGLALWQGRRRCWLLVGWLWFVGTLVPVCGLAQGGPQAWADRFSYWPHIGLFVVLVWGLAELVEGIEIPALVPGVAGAALLGVLVWRAGEQVRTWHDTFTLWEHVLEVSPGASRAHVNLGKMYERQGRMARARAHLREAVRLDPNSAGCQQMLGTLLLSLGQIEEAVACFQRALQLVPQIPDSWHNLGVAHLRLGNPVKAAACFRTALEIQPDLTQSLAGLSQALTSCGRPEEGLRVARQALEQGTDTPEAWQALGNASLAVGRVDEAVDALRRSLRLHPWQIQVQCELGIALGRLGDWNEAIDHFQQAVGLEAAREQYLVQNGGRPLVIDAVPQLALLHSRLAHGLKRQGDDEGARLEYQAALRRDPRWPGKVTKRAWKLLTGRGIEGRDVQLAYELASQAAEALDNPPARTLAVLTATQFVLGEIPDALATAQRTLKRALAEDGGQSVNAGSEPQPWDLPSRGISPID